MKKKLALLLLTCSMITVFCTGCNVTEAFTKAFFAELANTANSEESSFEESEESLEESTEESVEASETSIESGIESSEESAPSEEIAESSSEAQPSNNTNSAFSIGSVTDNVYTNEYFGLQYTPDSDLSFYDEGSLQMHYFVSSFLFEAPEIDVFDSNSVNTAVTSGVPVKVMFANNWNYTQLASIDILCDAKAASYLRSGKNEDFYNYFAECMEILLITDGYDVISMSQGTATFLGNSVMSFDATTTYMDTTIYVKQICIIRDYYIAVIRTAGDTENAPDEMLKSFSSYGDSQSSVTTTGATSDLHPLVGITEGNTYTNSVLGLQCKLDKTWSYDSLDVLEELAATSYDTASFDSALERGDSLAVMCASTGDGPSISLAVDKSGYLFDYLSPEAFFTAMEEEMKTNYIDTYTQLGFENCEFKVGTADFLGETVSCFESSSSFLGRNIYQKQLYLPCGEYAITLTVTHDSAEEIQEVLDCFSEYKQ